MVFCDVDDAIWIFFFVSNIMTININNEKNYEQLSWIFFDFNPE